VQNDVPVGAENEVKADCSLKNATPKFFSDQQSRKMREQQRDQRARSAETKKYMDGLIEGRRERDIDGWTKTR
jgi:hypothetical protein